MCSVGIGGAVVCSVSIIFHFVYQKLCHHVKCGWSVNYLDVAAVQRHKRFKQSESIAVEVQ